MNTPVSNPNDFKVVNFTNSTDFDFTHEMGCMYSGQPIFGISGVSGIKSGESKTLPYHVGNTLARNLAKQVMLRGTTAVQQFDAQGGPIIKSIWDDEKLTRLKNSFLTDLYTEAKPIAQTETQMLLEKVKQLEKFVEANVGVQTKTAETGAPVAAPAAAIEAQVPKVYQDKAEVIAELTKRGIKFDARQNKASLEKLLV